LNLWMNWIIFLDHLRSMEIEEKVNAIRFLRRRTNSHMLLTTNDKTIKVNELLYYNNYYY
jgi:hypothetical protein